MTKAFPPATIFSLPDNLVKAIEAYGRACYRQGKADAGITGGYNINSNKPLVYKFNTVEEMLENFAVPMLTRNALIKGGYYNKTLQQLRVALQDKTIMKEPFFGQKSYKLIVSILEASRI